MHKTLACVVAFSYSHISVRVSSSGQTVVASASVSGKVTSPQLATGQVSQRSGRMPESFLVLMDSFLLDTGNASDFSFLILALKNLAHSPWMAS